MKPKYGLQVITNDALVVLCLRDIRGPQPLGTTIPVDTMTHHQFRVRAAKLGFKLTRSQCHNMLHRAAGRVVYDPSTYEWRLTAMGLEYRRHVLETLYQITRGALT